MNDRHVEAQDLFALVTYTPEPFRTRLAALRRLLPVEANSQPHITILPPRPLTMQAEEARQKITCLLAPWEAFEVELSGVRVFPGTNVLYLEVSSGNDTLARLHADLNMGGFFHQEAFEFHPHVTVGGPVPAEDLENIFSKARDAWQTSVCPVRFKIEEIAFVSIPENGKHGDWRRCWTHKLAETANQKAARAAFTSQTF